jgi:hypothetical protein
MTSVPLLLHRVWPSSPTVVLPPRSRFRYRLHIAASDLDVASSRTSDSGKVVDVHLPLFNFLSVFSFAGVAV